MSNCTNCGANLRPQAKFCNVCGTAVPIGSASNLPAIGGDAPAPTSLVSQGSSGSSSAQVLLNSGLALPLYMVTTIGRDPQQCNCLLADDERISRAHARLEERGGQWFLSDLGSYNGTFVNGSRISSSVSVGPEDLLQVGDTQFHIHIPGRNVQVPDAWQQPVQPIQPGDPGQIGGPGAPDPLGLQVPVPPGGWTTWKKRPQAEGIVRTDPRTYTMKKSDLMQKGCIAVVLATFMPILAFLPFIGGSDMNVTDIRIQDAQSNNFVSIKVEGDMLGDIGLGDIIAVWGKDQGGLLLMRTAYNYTTGHEIRVKK